ncbi:MAG: KilA-N domain-containing protein [Asticcacaulis sp.]
MNVFQIPLPLVQYEFEQEVIHQRVKDGYINATSMCKANDKQFNDYARLKTTPLFLSELSSETGIPVSELVQSIKGGVPALQGTWVHPQVAISLAQWLSPVFAVRVTKWIFDWMSGKVAGGNLPYHLRRYMANLTNVPSGHFSMLNEMTTALIAPLEHMGYVLPSSMLPDISEGRMLCKWVLDQGYNTDELPTYKHVFEDGRVVYPKAYPNNLLADFRRHFIEVWMHKNAMSYFGQRDQNAIKYIENLLSLPNYRDIAGFLPAA